MKKIHPSIYFIVVFFVIAISFSIELHYLTLRSVPFLTKLLLLLPLNLTILALLTLMFYVGKSLVKLYFERKNRILGYKFKTKLVVTLGTLTLIPAFLLFIFSSGLITRYIDRWFIPEIRQPLEQSIDIAKSIYEIERQRILDYANAVSSNHLSTSKYRIRHFTALPDDASETIRGAFRGMEGTEVISSKKGDIVRAAVPAYEEGQFTGVLVIESQLPIDITENVEQIKDVYESYLTLDTWKIPIKMNYLLVLGFLTLIVVFFALWIGLKISRGITDPIQNLALATDQVASGNLDINVGSDREDEIGLLIHSFNDMVKKIKTGQSSLQSAYLYMKTILDNINSGVIMLDTSGNISVINGAACTILNIEHNQIANKSYKELLSKIDSQELQTLVNSIEGRTFRPLRKEVRAFIDNRSIIISVFITSLRASHEYIGLLVVFDDITDIIEAQKARTWQEMARRIAHEIKNPLTPIRLSTERLVKKWEHKEADFDNIFERSTKTIVKEVESLRRLVDEFSRYGKMPEIKKTPIDLLTLIEEIVHLYKGYKGIEINTSIPVNVPEAEVDEEQFKRVLINIFENAIQAMPGGGLIHIALDYDEEDAKAYIHITDNGPGISDEDKEKLFLPYFSTKTNGTGLGLAIAHRIIAEHGGHIRIKNNEPRGTIFTIEIPIKER